MDSKLIAPCGMNCALCAGYLAKKTGTETGIKINCDGCRPQNRKCAHIKKSCKLLLNNEIQYCYECSAFPCQRLSRLDDRYQAKYHMSMIDNLNYIKEHGIAKFIKQQENKWRCPRCGGTLCCHNGLCFQCDLEKLQQKKHKYVWEKS
jgi:hypothetical protein